jgi:hypothetical protein
MRKEAAVVLRGVTSANSVGGGVLELRSNSMGVLRLSSRYALLTPAIPVT